jgi:hypothetical protein
MKITDQMLNAAIDKAVELGIIPSYNTHMQTIKNDMRQVLEAALSATKNNAEENNSSDKFWKVGR